MAELYIGLMSGTSLDGMDAALVDFSSPRPRLIHALSLALPGELQRSLADLCRAGENEIDRLGTAELAVADLSAEAVQKLLAESGVAAGEVRAIGSHGQTIRHRPAQGFTLQIGDPSRIAQLTGITTVADFRRRDMAAGGQGAPLVPAFHAAFFARARHDQVVLNIGGMANITHLPATAEGTVSGFDTGPGNILLDIWSRRHLARPFDTNGDWAAGGRVLDDLLARLLDDAYLRRPPPKSTGREYFNEDCLDARIGDSEYSPQDVQTTLCEFTARSAAEAIQRHAPAATAVWVCGGGAHNRQLMARLGALLGPTPVSDTTGAGLAPDWVEAVAFAWLARETLAGRPGNLPAVTGAREAVVLGGIYPA